MNSGSDPSLGIFTGRVRSYGEVTSTNDIVAEWADAGGEEGLVAIADSQSRGRGRLGRSWSSPAGAGLYISVLLRPPDVAMPFVTLAAGVALADGIEASTTLRTILKWPNDVCVALPDGSWRKLAGILAEARSAPDGARYVVLGIGVNITAAAHPPEVLDRATSIEAAIGGPVDREALIVECLAALSGAYEMLRRGEAAAILDAWTSRAAATFGRHVVWDAERGEARGVVEGIDASGALLIRTLSGNRRVRAGEVRWI